MRRYAPFSTLVLFAVACSTTSDRHSANAASDTLVVYDAASLVAPMRAALDSFSRHTGTTIEEEHGASLELARRITELHRVPDVIALADREVFPELLVPSAMSWYATFARNRMVVAYTDKSRYASEITADNWRTILQRNEVLVGRTDPVLAPAGYRTLILFRLAESFYHDNGLAARLEARTPSRLMRGNAADLAALLTAGELDYIVDYESLAHAQHFKFISLPPDIDLGDAAHASTYATASVLVPNGRDIVERHGAPILYAAGVPRAAPHSASGLRFLTFLLSDTGRTIMRAHNIDMLDRATFTGDSIPAALRTPAAP